MSEQSAEAQVDVLVCTYRRPELLARTLRGVEMAAEGLRARVIVVDNDDAQSARRVVESHAGRTSLTYTYLSQPVQNISMTRNCALEASTAPYVALVDDDAVPERHWLVSLLATAHAYHADIVFAPVLPEYESGVPDWTRRGGFFSFRRRHPTGSRIAHNEMRSGNVLLRTEAILPTRFRFDPTLGLSGGEDSMFFAQLNRAGLVHVWCDDAPVHEWIPLSRASVRWLMTRSFRIGSLVSFMPRRGRRWGAVLHAAAKGAALAVVGTCAVAVWCAVSKHRCVRGLQRLSQGLGIYYGIFIGPYSEYKARPARKGILST